MSGRHGTPPGLRERQRPPRISAAEEEEAWERLKRRWGWAHPASTINKPRGVSEIGQKQSNQPPPSLPVEP